VDEVVAATLDEVVNAVGKIGFPLVLKGLGSALSHKTERGLVHLGLTSLIQVEEAARAIHSAAGKHLEGFLIQPQLQGRREFVAGLFRDPQFGAVILFGLGGILTEALSDVSLRLAPLTLGDAEQMITEIKAQSLLGSFRGEKAVDRKAIVDTLLGLSKLSQQRPDIAEIDINPCWSPPMPQAVDALVVLGNNAQSISSTRFPPRPLGRCFTRQASPLSGLQIKSANGATCCPPTPSPADLAERSTLSIPAEERLPAARCIVASATLPALSTWPWSRCRPLPCRG
jgi:hypothetical protein